ncbi:NADPH-dependent glutamate synthase [Tepidiforma bonchosmolovskayae]|jgi:glutamate synthase (NADPH/NADH) small chain|uniref:NADPH-dependent glutamate synthase n=1 Tax=Tepidiforma bonchosmolovskayae TaxID=2601677 RepID=A0ABX6BYX1_9CHLR|nr:MULTISPECIES: NADPH-dependent glutamate synthase [Tepidiforma]QFG02180.1 NADPH-dependent glutamate synthase [Tepidiforma bonchosmolovskayae]GIW19682.1 MAG: glutamate synthase (NADPH), homotetrameric [Tepidiforma sp.]
MANDVARRLAISVQPVPKQDPEERKRNFEETYLGFDLNAARIEASRCIQCPSAPCQEACPVHNDIPGALALIEAGDILGAADKFRETSNLPEMCGRLCPQEKLCEGACVVGFAIRPGGKQEPPVTIGKLEAFCTDYQRQQLGGYPMPRYMPEPTGFKVAVIGSGPAGLAVAEQLADKGHSVTVYEYWPEPGGVLVYGIPNFKMRKNIVDEYIAHLEAMGVRFICNTYVGRDITIDELFQQGFHAVFIGTGAGVGNEMGIEGEDLEGVYSATEFLVRGNLAPEMLPERLRTPLPKLNDVVVIGGGDTSMDCVRTAVRLGAQNVTCVYRRTEAEMLGREEERKNAREEGVRFEMLTLPTRILGDENGRVRAVECQRMQLGEPDETGRRRPIPVPGSEFVIPADAVVIAIGYGADPVVPQTTSGIRTDRKALIQVDEKGRTTRPGVFAGGDNVNGADLVVTALADGRRAAEAIHEYLMSLPAPRR